MDGMRITAGPDDRLDLRQGFEQTLAYKIQPVQPFCIPAESAFRSSSGKSDLVKRDHLPVITPVEGGNIAAISSLQKFPEPFQGSLILRQKQLRLIT